MFAEFCRKILSILRPLFYFWMRRMMRDWRMYIPILFQPLAIPFFYFSLCISLYIRKKKKKARRRKANAFFSIRTIWIYSREYFRILYFWLRFQFLCSSFQQFFFFLNHVSPSKKEFGFFLFSINIMMRLLDGFPTPSFFII